jgi:hypothetical protein
MRREIILEAVRRVLADLETTGIAEMARSGFERVRNSPTDREKLDWIQLGVVTDYINKVRAYGEAERRILKILDLEALGVADTWQEQIREPDTAFAFSLHNRIRNSLTFLPKFASILERDYKTSETRPAETVSDTQTQTVILTDEGDSLSSPQRLVELLSSMQQIYSVIAEVEGLPSETLAVVGMDSGSEKSFDFLGLAQLMHELRETLQSVYNMIVYHKQNVTIKNLQVASETLHVAAKISRMEGANELSAEDASRLRHSLYQGLERFVSTGAYTPEMETPAQSPALVVRPQPRLLTGPVDAMVRAANDAGLDAPKEASDESARPNQEQDDGARGFSDDEIAAAVALLKKAQSQQADEPASDQKKGGRTRRKRPSK